MKILNVSNRESPPPPNEHFYIILESDKYEGVGRDIFEADCFVYPDEGAALAECRNLDLFDHYIARVEIVAKTV